MFRVVHIVFGISFFYMRCEFIVRHCNRHTRLLAICADASHSVYVLIEHFVEAARVTWQASLFYSSPACRMRLCACDVSAFCFVELIYSLFWSFRISRYANLLDFFFIHTILSIWFAFDAIHLIRSR